MRKVFASVVVASIVAAAAVVHFRPPHYADPIPFDASAWSAGEKYAGDPYGNQAPRLAMAVGLIENEALKGKTKSETLAMLGPVTETGKFRDYDLVYWLGPHGIDSLWLAIQFGRDKKMAEARIIGD